MSYMHEQTNYAKEALAGWLADPPKPGVQVEASEPSSIGCIPSHATLVAEGNTLLQEMYFLLGMFEGKPVDISEVFTPPMDKGPSDDEKVVNYLGHLRFKIDEYMAADRKRVDMNIEDQYRELGVMETMESLERRVAWFVRPRQEDEMGALPFKVDGVAPDFMELMTTIHDKATEFTGKVLVARSDRT